MDASLLLPRGGVRSLGKKKLADGNDYELFFLSRTPSEVMAYDSGLLSLQKFADEPAKLLPALHALRTKLLAACLCDEAGEVLMTPEVASGLDQGFARKLCESIRTIDSELGDAGKD